MKKSIIFILTLSLLFSSLVIPTALADDIKIIIDGVEQSYDVMPVIIEGRTLVPLRGIFEALGARVGWEAETRTITGAKDDKTIVLQPDNLLASVSGKEVTLDVPPKIISDRTMVPVRFISEALGAEVGWDDATRTVTITSPAVEVVEKTYTIIDWEIFKSASKKYQNSLGTIEFKDDVLNVKCETLSTSDAKFNITITTAFDSIIKEGDACLMSFKVKVNSGEGYVKPWVQGEGNKKSLFALTTVGKAGEDFVECYLPFAGIPDMRDIGIRFGGAIQDITIKDFKIENFGSDKKIAELPSTITGENGISPSFEKYYSESFENQQSPSVETNTEATTTPSQTTDGTIIIDWNKFKSSIKRYTNGFGSIEVKDDVVNIKCETLPEKDSKFNFTVVTDFESIIKPGDACLMSFKVKVNSGEGYVKPWVQDTSSKKALFAQTATGKAGDDFVECYLPFVGIPNMRDIGIRLGGAIQDITIKDFKVENFGTSKKLSELPSTITGNNDTSPSFKDLMS